MVSRALCAIAALTAVSGCAAVSEGTAAACPDVREVNAWVNRMPGPGPRTPALTVSVEFSAPAAFQLRRIEAGPADELLLELVSAEIGPAPATSFRESLKDPPRARVRVICAGETLAEDTDIETVY